jgi:transcriptional regulator with XRE-family HTH domain
MEPKERFNKLLDKYKDDPEFIFQGFILKVSEKIASLLEDQHMSRTDLAKALSCSPAYITKLLRGSENLTLRKLFEVSRALGAELSVNVEARSRGQNPKKTSPLSEKISSEAYVHRQQKSAVVAEKKSK